MTTRQPNYDKAVPTQKDDTRKCWKCLGFKTRIGGPIESCPVCHGSGELSGPLTDHEIQIMQDAREDAAELKNELRRERGKG